MKNGYLSFKEIGSILKQKIIETYPEYIQQFPNYRKALDIMEVIMSKAKPEKMMLINNFDEEIKKVIQIPNDTVIEIIPKVEPTILAWNSDYYFDNYYLWTDFRSKPRGLIKVLELLANASALVKLFFSSRLHLILYDMTDYYNLSIIDALKLKQAFPITQLMNRIRNYYQIPVIKFRDIEPYQEELEDMKKKVMENPNNKDVKKYEAQINEFEQRSGIKLTTEEKIEFIAEKLLSELITEDYDEIES